MVTLALGEVECVVHTAQPFLGYVNMVSPILFINVKYAVDRFKSFCIDL